MQRWKQISQEQLQECVQTSKSYTEVLKKLRFTQSGKQHKNLISAIQKYNIDVNHFVVKNKRELVEKRIKEELPKLVNECRAITEIAKKLNINYTRYNLLIQKCLKDLNLKINKKLRSKNPSYKLLIWTEQEENLLKNNYGHLPADELKQLFPDRTYDALKLKARQLNLSRYYREDRNCNLSVLLEDNYIAYYWLGFLMADGHFTKNRIVLTLATKDQNQVQKFSDFIQNKGNIQIRKINAGVAAMDAKIVPKIREKFSIKNRKTYEPCDLTNITDDNLLLALLIGFIDGDGSIGKQSENSYYLRIKCHNSWLNNFFIFYDLLKRLTNIDSPKPKILNSGYAFIGISKNKIIKYLKNKTIEMNLPVLERKWNLITL